MKKIIALCGLILLGGALWTWRALQTPTHFGEFVGAPLVPITELVDRPQDFLGKPVAVEGMISEQCKAMGCFFSFHSGTKALRVELKEIAMNAPMREGRQARVEGQLVPFNGGYQLFASAIDFK